MPANLPAHRVRIYGPHAAMETAFRRQTAGPCFPVDCGRMGAAIHFVRRVPDRRDQNAGHAALDPGARLRNQVSRPPAGARCGRTGGLGCGKKRVGYEGVVIGL